MSQYEEDSALPFAEIEENPVNSNNIYGSRKKNSQNKDELKKSSSLKQNLDNQQMNQLKKQNVTNSNPQKAIAAHEQIRQKRNSSEINGTTLPRINGGNHLSQDKIQKKDHQNLSINETNSTMIQNKKSFNLNANQQGLIKNYNMEQKGGSGMNSLSFSNINLISQNLQINSAKFQKKLYQQISSAQQLQQGLTFTQRVDNLAFPISNYQMAINSNDYSINKIPQKNFRQTTQNFNDQIRRSTITNSSDANETFGIVQLIENQNNVPIVKSHLKDKTHEIHKLITPNAYKVLKMKQTNSSNGAKEGDNKYYQSSIVNKCFSPVKQRFSNQNIDEKTVGYDFKEEGQDNRDFKTLSDIMENQPNQNNKETIQEQIEKLKSQIPKLMSTQKNKKNVQSATSLQELYEHHQLMNHNQNIDKLASQLQLQQRQINVQTIDSEDLNNSKGREKQLDKYQVGNSQFNNQINISQFNNNVENTLNESALINQEKVSIIKEMNQKSNNKTNFYGQFISRCLEQSQLDMLNTPLKNLKKKELFETDLEKIKVSSQLLDIIDKQIFQENDQADQIESQFASNDQDSQSNQSQRQARKKGVLTQKQKDKLFQVLADTDKIVVHTSQNKDLMVPSERKDVVRLAQWLEEMLEKIYNIKDQDFYEYFENIQLVCSACMSEIIRQISVSLQERGNLVKRVWESFLNLMKQAFEQLTQEKIENEKNLKEEIKQIHKMYLKKLDEYLPEIEKQKKKLEQQETQNKRVVLEFRYLRKKDTKLEKYLKLAKKDLRQLEEDYARLDQDYQKFKLSYEKQEKYYQQELKNQKQAQKSSGISFNKQDKKSEVENFLNEHIKNYNDITNKAKLGFENFNENYENYNKDIQQLHDKYVQDVKKFQKGNKVQIEDLDQFEENIYSKKAEIDKIMQLDERIIEEIEGNDGIILIIAHCGVQTGPDLLKMTHQSVDTSSLTSFKERTTQTFVAQIDVKEIQTPAEWMAVNIDSTSPSNNNGNSFKAQKGQKPSKFSSTSKINSQNEVEDDDEEIQRKRIEIEQQEQRKLEKIKQLVFKTEDEETQERQKLQQLPFVKQFLIDSPMLQKSGLLLNWKDQPTSQQNEEDNNQSDAINSSSDEQEDQIDENQNNADGTASGGSSPRKSKKIHESLSKTISNKVEKDLEDLHTLVMSRTSYVTSLCEKIIKHQLLKENEIVTIQMVEQFIDDSKQIILEEHNRLKRIWERSKKGILEQVKSKIIIAEKDAELQEVQNNKEIIEQQIKFFRKEINLMDDKKSDSSTIIETNNKKKNSQSFNSLEDITDEDEFEDSNNNLSSLDEDEISEKSHSESTISLKNDTGIQKMEGSIQKQESKKYKPDSVLTQNVNKQRNSIIKKPVNNSSEKSSNALVPPSPLLVQSSPTKNIAPILQIQQNSLQQKRIKKKQTLNPLNRVSISLIEAVQGSKTQQKGEDSPLIIEKRFTPISQKKESIFGSLTNQQSTISSQSFISSSQSSQSLWLKTIQINNKLSSTNTSPNSDSAAIFFNKFALKIMVKEVSKADKKTVIMKQQNVLRHLQSIYQDKIKTIKNSEEDTNGGSRTLNVVTYDYFLNQFGFKKLAETKLKQFLDSCIYYNINFKIRQFTKLYGINKIMNYDFEDFDFFIKMMLFLEEGSSQQQIQANIYPINRVVEALFRNFENKIPASEMIRLKQELENMKIPDSTAKQKNKFAIDSDHALDILLQALIEEKKLCIQNLQSVYLAGDISCDQVIAYEEYLTLFRHFESGLFNILSVTKFYYQNCDFLDRFTNQRIMSFQKFALTSVQGDLFSKQIQEDYSNKIDNYDRIKNIDSLERHWEDKKDVIRLRFVKNRQYKLIYRQMIKRIDDHFALKKEQRNQQEKNITWFVYRLLDDESKRIMTEQLIDQLIPEEFNILTNFEIDLIKKFCLNA
ncbi:hypothetical protein ABPG72_009828 [Tetrahymena utriculariae]